MIQRVITGAGFTVLVLACISLQGWAMFGLISAFMLIGMCEMYRALRNAGYKTLDWTGYLFCLLMMLTQALGIKDTGICALLACTLAVMVQLVFRGKIAFDSLIASVFPMIYPGIFFIALLQLLQLENRAVVTTALVLAFFAASVNDVFALFSGLLFGKHKLSPELSPKKTIEGSIGGLIFSTLFSMLVPALLRLIFARDAAFIADMAALPPVWAFALLGFMAGGLSQIGDLAASMVKRHCGVKDFGKLLPGHGGVMDRLDGVLFCGAACYIFFKLSGLG